MNILLLFHHKELQSPNSQPKIFIVKKIVGAPSHITPQSLKPELYVKLV